MLDVAKNCHPERSRSQFHRERRSRRTCIFALAVVSSRLALLLTGRQKINRKTLSHVLLTTKVFASRPRLPHIAPQIVHRFTTPKTSNPSKTNHFTTTNFLLQKIRANPHPDRYHPGFPQ
jgi:hypothetical protein